MLNIINSLFGSIMSDGTITGMTFLGATGCSLAIGIFIAYMYKIKNESSQSYIVTLALLPAIVQLVIMLVNGNIGAGIAVAGASRTLRPRQGFGLCRCLYRAGPQCAGLGRAGRPQSAGLVVSHRAALRFCMIKKPVITTGFLLGGSAG